MFRNLLVAAAVVSVISLAAAPALAQFGTGNSANNLFSQYHTQPGASMVQAGMYPAPHYVPANVGHTYYTYQPLMPHEMMYQHSRNYYNYYNTGGFYGCGNDSLNKTQVRWQSGANHMGYLPFSGGFVNGLHWKIQQRKYNLNPECRGCQGRCGGLRGKLGCCGGGCGTGETCGGEDTCTGGCPGGECAATNDQSKLRR